MAWARPQGSEAEPVQQVIDGLRRAQHAELGFQDAADVLAPPGADAVRLGRAAAESVAQPLFLLG